MLRSGPIRGFAFALTIGAALCATAQIKPASTLPPTAPTAAPTQPQIAPLSATAAQPDAATRAHRAEVQYASGLLSINANNSSLNQILREISRLTGMKITGGVREERVFGHYGPASPEIILGTLIDSNSTNMIIHETASNAPIELILTPRAGGPSPPNPSAPGFDDNNNRDDDPRLLAPQQQEPPRTFMGRPGQRGYTGPPTVPPPANNVNGSPLNSSPTASMLPVTNSVPTDSIPTPSTTPPTSGIVDAPNPPDPNAVNPVSTFPPVNQNLPGTDVTTPTDPNAPKTPEQVFQQLQQLQQLRQQQQQQNPNTTITPQ